MSERERSLEEELYETLPSHVGTWMPSHYAQWAAAQIRKRESKLREALKRYGDHRFHCAFVKCPSKNCDCGWTDQRVALQGGE